MGMRVLMAMAAVAAAAYGATVSTLSLPLSLTGTVGGRTILFDSDYAGDQTPNVDFDFTFGGPGSGAATLPAFTFVTAAPEIFGSTAYQILLTANTPGVGFLALNPNGTFTGSFTLLADLTFSLAAGGSGHPGSGDVLGEWGDPGGSLACGGPTCTTVLALNVAGSWFNDGGYAFENTQFSQIESAPVPEPGTLALLLAGLGVTVWARRRRTA